MARRGVFSELIEGVTAMKGRHENKLTLRSYKIKWTASSSATLEKNRIARRPYSTAHQRTNAGKVGPK